MTIIQRVTVPSTIIFLLISCHLVSTSTSLSTQTLDEEEDQNILILREEIEQWMAQPEQDISSLPSHLKQVLATLNSSVSDQNVSGDKTERIFRGPTSYCGPCKILATLGIGYARIGGPINILANFLVKVCYLLAYKSTDVCRGLIYQDTERLHYIIRHTNVNADAVCSLALGNQGCGPFKGPAWSVPIPLPHSHTKYQSGVYARYSSSVHFRRSISPNRNRARSIDFGPPKHQLFSEFSDEYHKEPKPDEYPPGSKKILKVLHLTDPHYDPHYKVGSNAVCDAPLCCNAASGRPSSPGQGAGRWGDYRNCDSPKWLLENMLNHIKTQHPDIDYIMCTGDIVPHHIWKITKRANVKVIQEMVDMVQYFFPDTLVYGSIGNHESFPRDSYPPPEIPKIFNKFGNRWLYNVVTDGWEKLQKQKLPSTSRFAGYYSILIRPGFRLISMNTNFCYTLNWWVLYKPIDPGNVLNWLVKELQGAETRGELVHIIGHVPPLYVDCYAQWAHQFSRIVSRYSHIIKGQFYGHSHMDEYRMHYDVKNPRRPVGVEYVSPNNGPFNDLNPSYRVFYVDGDYPGTTRNILDYETWAMNLTHANIYDDPYWYKLYSARQDLHLPDLSPHSWDKFAKRLSKSPSLFAKYHRYQLQDSGPALYKGCDNKCRREKICQIVDGDAYMPKKCRRYYQ